MGGRVAEWPGGWVAGSNETKAISALKLELKLELAGAELGNIFDISLIFSVFSYIFTFKVQKNIDIENFGNLFETLGNLVSKWLGISKIYPPILDYRMLCVLSNNKPNGV